MLNYQKFHFNRYYVMDTNGMTAPCTRCECFAAPDDLPGCPYKQRWLYDEEAGYAVRLPRTKLGDDLGRFNQAFLKKEERYRDRRSAQVSIDQPRFNDDGDEVGGMDFADPNVDIEGRFIEQDSKSAKGHGKAVKALLRKYQAAKLSDVDPSDYADLLLEAQAIGAEVAPDA